MVVICYQTCFFGIKMITLLQKNSFEFDERSDQYLRFNIKDRLGIDCVLNALDTKMTDMNDIKNHVYFLKGRTGSGKSTCLPMKLFKHLIDNGNEFVKINVLQPRVILAQSIPASIAEIDSYFKLGQNIGYSTGSGVLNATNNAKITFMTTDIF